MPRVHGSNRVFPDELKRVSLHGCLVRGDYRHRTVWSEVSVEQGQETSLLTAAGPGGTNKRSRHFDLCPCAGEKADFGVLQEGRHLRMANIVGEVGTGEHR